jgi:hypothetical protein
MKSNIPLMGLTQVCQVIRKEFRPWWLRQHVVAIDDGCKYVKAFRQTAKSDVDSGMSKENALSFSFVYMTTQPPYTHNILPLLRFFATHPMDVAVCYLEDVDTQIKPLESLFRHRNKSWLALLAGDDMGALCMEPRRFDRVHAQFKLCGVGISSIADLYGRCGWWDIEGLHFHSIAWEHHYLKM